MSSDSYKKPYLFGDYEKTRNTRMEREVFNPNSPERVESQFKKPYLHGTFPESEWTLSTPGRGFYPSPPGLSGTPGVVCQPKGAAIGGGPVEWCSPSVKCGVWDYSCCHQIISFSALGGQIQSVQQTGGDTCRVTACWDESAHGLSVIGTLANGNTVIEGADKGACLGAGHDNHCTDCFTCLTYFPIIAYTSQTMNLNTTQTLSVSGGGGGPYVWSITSGGGTLSRSIGPNVIYQAPTTNASCVNNPTIKVVDYCGKETTLKLTITNYNDQYAAAVHFFFVTTNHWAEYCNCIGACGGGGAAGPCACCGSTSLPDCEAAGYCGAPAMTGCVPCNDAGGGHDCTPRYQDIRTVSQLAGGCCPGYLVL